MSDPLPPLRDDDIRALYAETLRVRAACHARLDCGGAVTVEPASLAQALPRLALEKRSRLQLMLIAALAGYADLLANDPENPELRERMIAVCGRLDNNLHASLTRVLFAVPAKRKSHAGRKK